MTNKTPIEIKKDVDYLISKVNIGASFFDARAITIMNTYGNDLIALQNNSNAIDIKMCHSCKHFGKYTLHHCDGGLSGCKLLHIEDSDRKLGGCLKWEAK